jgi:hypothetical protein
MARPVIKLPCTDLAIPDIKRRVIQQVGVLVGIYDIEFDPRRDTRSNRQNAWYWACIVSAFAAYMRDQDYEIITDDEAHEFLKARFLAVSVHNRRTGEVIGRRVRSTTELSTEQFCEYCERCRAWLADFFGIIVPDPQPWETRTVVSTVTRKPRRIESKVLALPGATQ